MGALIGFSGFLGDVSKSSVKRDLNIKDSGNLISGYGGILVKMDSLTYTNHCSFIIKFCGSFA